MEWPHGIGILHSTYIYNDCWVVGILHSTYIYNDCWVKKQTKTNCISLASAVQNSTDKELKTVLNLKNYHHDNTQQPEILMIMIPRACTALYRFLL